MRNLINLITEGRLRLSYEVHGLPTEVYDDSDIENGIERGDLKPDTLVTVFKDGETRPLLRPASEVPEINKFFGAPEGHKMPANDAGPKRIRVTRALERIHGADLQTERGAHDLLAALHDLCDSVMAWVENRGEIAMAMKKAVDEAKAHFPQNAQMAMTNRHVPRNIKDGLQIIRNELKHYDVVLENASRRQFEACIECGHEYSKPSVHPKCAECEDALKESADVTHYQITHEEVRQGYAGKKGRYIHGGDKAPMLCSTGDGHAKGRRAWALVSCDKCKALRTKYEPTQTK